MLPMIRKKATASGTEEAPNSKVLGTFQILSYLKPQVPWEPMLTRHLFFWSAVVSAPSLEVVSPITFLELHLDFPDNA